MTLQTNKLLKKLICIFQCYRRRKEINYKINLWLIFQSKKTAKLKAPPGWGSWLRNKRFILSSITWQHSLVNRKTYLKVTFAGVFEDSCHAWVWKIQFHPALDMTGFSVNTKTLIYRYKGKLNCCGNILEISQLPDKWPLS